MARKADPTIRKRLIAAAQDEFSERGLSGAKVSSIAFRAGVSKGAFYLHFPNKEYAFNEVTQLFFDGIYRYMALMDELISSDEETDFVRAQLVELDIANFEYLWERRAFAKMLFDGPHSKRHGKLVEAFVDGIEVRLRRILAADVAAGRLRQDLDPGLLAAFLAGGYNRYARILLQTDRKPNIRADLHHLKEFTYRGISTNEDSSEALLAPPSSREQLCG